MPSLHRAGGFALLAGGLALLTACGSQPPPADSLSLPAVTGEELQQQSFTLFSYHLQEPPPAGSSGSSPTATAALVTYLSDEYPDILALQGIPSEREFQTLVAQLGDEGLRYPHQARIPIASERGQLAVLSRYPIVLQSMRTNDSYSIEGTVCAIDCGILDVSIVVDCTFLLRLFVADLVGKEFHPLGQAEMRRNEARLLAQHVRRALKDQPDQHMVVACSLGDIQDSAGYREITTKKGGTLRSLELSDVDGNRWTYYGGEDAGYLAHDFLFVSPALAERVLHDQSRICRDIGVQHGSPYRPLVMAVQHRQ